MPVYGTLEWFQELKKLVNADPIVPKLLKGCSTTMIYKISDRPEIKPVLERIEDGKVVEVRYAKPDEAAEYSYWADMAVWKAIFTGELEQTKALLERKLNMQGPLKKMQQYMKGWIKLSELQKKVPTEW